MIPNLSERGHQVIALAGQESRHYRHAYVGTEHLLLGLVGDSAGEIVSVLRTLGIDSTRIRQGIEKLIEPGPVATTAAEIPLTPRSNSALEIAAEEARDANQKLVEPAHLFLGLLREPHGVAGKVLVDMGLNLIEVREAVLKIRREQMKLVERTVRPVRASVTRKRKMREELLSHLTGIYEEELARLGNPSAALRAAADRFGDPAALASELNETLPLTERATYFINRSQGLRPHESIPHYVLRLATGMTAFVAAFFCSLVLVAVFLKDGWNVTLILAKPLIGILPFMFVDVFLLGLLYFKLRDAICGAPWARKSWPRAIVREALIALITFGSALAFNAFANIPSAVAPRALYISLAIAAVAAIVFPIVARVDGPDQITDAIWADLDLEDSVPEIA